MDTAKQSLFDNEVAEAAGAAEKAGASFEESMQRLEILVRQLERGELGLEQSLTCFEEGIGLVKLCQGQLDRAAQQIQILTTVSKQE